jgi:hypothetical protein
MGAYWLLDLPEACRYGGLDVSTFDGWETRSRSSGGYDDVLAVGYHHDASNPNSDEGSSDDYGWLYAADKPIGAMRLHRDGSLVVGAAGATNTMGKGGPLTCSAGTVPLDRGNQTMIAIEAANNGVGERWPKVQADAYVALVGALCDWYGLDPGHDVHSHAAYCAPTCPGRKIDPAGPVDGYPDIAGTSGAATWNNAAFARHVAAWTTPTPPPNGDDDMTQEEHDMLKRVYDALFIEESQMPGYPSIWTSVTQDRTTTLAWWDGYPGNIMDGPGDLARLLKAIAAKVGA